MLVLVACGTDHLQSASRLSVSSGVTSSATPSTALDRVLRSYTIESGHIHIDPPAVTDQPVISRDEALTTLRSLHAYSATTQEKPTDVKFGRFTDNDVQTINSDGSRTPDIQDVRAWIITYFQVPDEIGPLGGPGRGTYTPGSTRATLVFAINATTGRMIETLTEGSDVPTE